VLTINENGGAGGYLFLAATEEGRSTIEENYSIQKASGEFCPEFPFVPSPLIASLFTCCIS
jgi:hypothetical protein